MITTDDKILKVDEMLNILSDSACSLMIIADGLDERCGKDSEEGRGVHYIAESLKQQVTVLQELLLM